MGKQAAAFEQAQGPLAHRFLDLLDVRSIEPAGVATQARGVA